MEKKSKKQSIILFSLLPSFFIGGWSAISHWDSENLNPNPEMRIEESIDARANKEIQVEPEKALFDQMTSGQRSLDELDEEWSGWVGDSKGLKLADLELPDHRLTMMVTEVRNLSSNPYRVMFVHAFAKLSEEDAVTLYNRELDGIEEKNVKASIVTAMNIKKEKSKNFELQNLHKYHFQLSSSQLKRAFDLRAPRGQSEFNTADEGDFDLISEALSKLSEKALKEDIYEEGTYRTELMIGDKNHDVQMTLRKTDIETFTIDLRVQEIDSLVINKFALIYE